MRPENAWKLVGTSRCRSRQSKKLTYLFVQSRNAPSAATALHHQIQAGSTTDRASFGPGEGFRRELRLLAGRRSGPDDRRRDRDLIRVRAKAGATSSAHRARATG